MVPRLSRGWMAALAVGLVLPVPASAHAEEPPGAPEAAAGPWRLAEAVGSPDWLRFGLQQRTRYAHLFDSFRRDRPGDGGMLSLRSHLTAELAPGPLRVGAELLDSRAYLHNDVTLPTTGEVDALALLQAYVALELDDALAEGDRLRAAVGRLTLDVGSRRFAARNGYRNTINAFTGIDVHYGVGGGPRFRFFATMPIARRPDERDALDDNDVALDRESTDVIFAGQHVTTPALGADLFAEVYAFELVERDGYDLDTRDRRLFTPGVRVVRAPAAGRFDLELETAVQLGRSRASSDAGDREDLDHLASMQHAEAGYTFDLLCQPRIAARYDQASGDADPRDDTNGRFDTLYGARRFEYGPTGIYGAFARSNVRSPGLVVELTSPRTRYGVVSGFVGWRAFWLAQERDAWVTSGLRDPTGQSGTFLGNQLEGRIRFDPFPQNLRFEVGVAHLFAAGFATSAPGANRDANPTVLYSQIVAQL